MSDRENTPVESKAIATVSDLESCCVEHLHGKLNADNSNIVEYHVDVKDFQELACIVCRIGQRPKMSSESIGAYRFQLSAQLGLTAFVAFYPQMMTEIEGPHENT